MAAVYIGLGLILLGLTGLVGLRQWLLTRSISAAPQHSVQADLYPVADGWIAHLRGDNPQTTVIAMPGFLENPQYFSRYYQDPHIELILISATGYHQALHSNSFPTAPWTFSSTHPTGTISADAEILNLALEYLPSTQNIRVHGHSRGGAVVLEAAQQRPDLFNSVEVLLEAPVLPQGQLCRPSSMIARWLLPLLHLLWQRKPSICLSAPVWGPLQDSYKRELITGMPFNPRNSRLMLTNLQDLLDWMHTRSTDIYSHVQRGAILVPNKDGILHSHSMLDSARQAENLQIIEVPEGSHFVLLDNPESIPPLRKT